MHLKTFVEARYDSVVHEANRSDGFVPLEPGTFAYEIHRFAEIYRDAFPTQNISDQAKKDTENFRDFFFHDRLLRVWNHVCIQQGKDIKARGKVGIELLNKTLTRNRRLLEDLSASRSDKVRVQHLYGSRPFKCQVVFCFYFHEGFTNKKTCDKHVNCHERPFQCEVEDCSISGLGLASYNALQRHERTFHPELCDLSEVFAQLSRGTSTAKYACTLCPKSFTRNHNLQSHLDNHAGRRRHQCPECGKSFTRKSDLKRHGEKHSRGR